MEDLLTSNVFSFLKYAPRDIFLFKYIKRLGFEVTKEDARKATFLFWTTYHDLTEPDVVVLIGDYYLLFEAKLYSGFGEETDLAATQLARELDGGLSEAKFHNKTFQLIAITADHYQPPGLFQDLPVEYKTHLHWTSWQDFAFFLLSLLETSPAVSAEVRHFAEDLYALLDKKRLRKFEGTNALTIKDYSMKLVDQLFFSSESAKYRGDFLGFQATITIDIRIKPLADSIFFSTERLYYQSIRASRGILLPINDALYYPGGNDEK
jgi:hypothetical protein